MPIWLLCTSCGRCCCSCGVGNRVTRLDPGVNPCGGCPNRTKDQVIVQAAAAARDRSGVAAHVQGSPR